jgi:rubrerythrin
MSDESLSKYLQLAVLMEQNGQEFYSKMALKFSGEEEIARIFARLAKDEQMHAEEFQAIADKHAREAGELSGEALEFLQATSVSRFFNEDYRKHVEDKVQGPEDALMLAFRFERATLLFYGAINEAQGDSEAMRGIMKAEKEHLFSLMKVIMSDARFRGLADDF